MLYKIVSEVMQLFFILSPFFTFFTPEVAVIASDKSKMG